MSPVTSRQRNCRSTLPFTNFPFDRRGCAPALDLATALSCLADTDPDDAVPPVTPYVVMRVGRVPVVPYTRPGSPDVAPLIRARAADHNAVLLANHGPVVAASSLEGAVFAIEELEETAKLVLLTRNLQVRQLSPAEITDLRVSFS
jgi:ribulose-5-phosphate 4-epimerase/fuculose-1-phosphate aldolase